MHTLFRGGVVRVSFSVLFQKSSGQLAPTLKGDGHSPSPSCGAHRAFQVTPPLDTLT